MTENQKLWWIAFLFILVLALAVSYEAAEKDEEEDKTTLQDPSSAVEAWEAP